MPVRKNPRRGSGISLCAMIKYRQWRHNPHGRDHCCELVGIALERFELHNHGRKESRKQTGSMRTFNLHVNQFYLLPFQNPWSHYGAEKRKSHVSSWRRVEYQRDVAFAFEKVEKPLPFATTAPDLSHVFVKAWRLISLLHGAHMRTSAINYTQKMTEYVFEGDSSLHLGGWSWMIFFNVSIAFSQQ